MLGWQQKLVKCLELGISDDSLFLNLNEMLSWYSSFGGSDDNAMSDELSLELLKKYSQSDVRARFEEFLDRLLVSGGNLDRFFKMCASDAVAKKRYRQLIRVFHPDRGAKDQVWLNYRAEKVNRAYNAYKDGIQSGVDTPFEPPVYARAEPQAVKPKKAKAATKSFKLQYRSSDLRNVLGNPKDVQRRLLIGLGALSLFLILIFYVSSQSVPNTISVASNEEAPVNKVIAKEVAKPEQPLISVSAESDLRDEIDKIEQDFNSIQDDTQSSLEDDLIQSDSIEVNVVDPDIKALTSVDQDGEKNHKVQQPLESSKLRADSLAAVSTLARENTVVEKTVKRQPQRDSRPITKPPIKESPCSANNQYFGAALKTKGSTSSGNSSVRVGPSERCRILKTLVKHTPVIVLNKSRDGQWSYIQVDKKDSTPLRGWMHGLHIQDRVSPSHIVKNTNIDNKIQNNSKLQQQQSTASKQVKSSNVNPVKTTIQSLLERYVAAFESGNLNSLLSFYMSEAQEDELKGLNKISRYYKGAFSRTTQRKLKFSVDRFLQEDKLTAIVSGTYSIAFYNKAGGRLNEVQDRFEILFFSTNNGYKIASLSWSQ